MKDLISRTLFICVLLALLGFGAKNWKDIDELKARADTTSKKAEAVKKLPKEK